MVGQKQRNPSVFQISQSLQGIYYPNKKIGITEKQTGSCSQYNLTVFHRNEEPVCFIHHDQIFGSSRYLEKSFIRFCYDKEETSTNLSTQA